VPERPKGAVCKIAGVAYGGSNPPPPTDQRGDLRIEADVILTAAAAVDRLAAAAGH